MACGWTTSTSSAPVGYIKASAVYHPALAAFLATKIAEALLGCEQLESVVINDVLQMRGWRTVSCWRWHGPAHINILEGRAFVGLTRHLTLEGGDRRFNALLDSRVAKGAHAKGRSCARALRPSLKRACSFKIAGNLHPAFGFSPTRLKLKAHQLGERDLPDPATFSILDFFFSSELASLHSHQFSKATAGWIRLYTLAIFCFALVRAPAFLAHQLPQSNEDLHLNMDLCSYHSSLGFSVSTSSLLGLPFRLGPGLTLEPIVRFLLFGPNPQPFPSGRPARVRCP